MYRTTKVVALSALALLGASFGAFAQQRIPSTVCDGCTVTQMDRAVVTYSRNNIKMGVPTYVYVFNPTNDIVRKYDVLIDYDGDPTGCGTGGPLNSNCTISVLKTLVPAESQAGYLNVAFRAMGLPLTPIQLPGPGVNPNLPQNPYQDITEINRQYAVDTFLKNRNGVGSLQQALAITSAVGIFEAQPVYTLVYPTGGRVQYEFDTASQRWVPVKGSRVDADGNFFPEMWSEFVSSAPGVSLVIVFAGSSQSTIDQYLQNLQRIGVPVTGSQSSAPQKKLVCYTIKSGSGADESVTKGCDWI